MDQTTTLPLELGPELHRKLASYCEEHGLSLDQAVSQIVGDKLKKMEQAPDDQRAVVDIRTLPWQTMIPYARKIPQGMLFNVYDLAIRMHSKLNLSSLKLPGAWHSAFAMWVRRHSEFELVRVADGNSFRRNSDKEAPMPDVRVPLPRPLVPKRYTQAELQHILRMTALHKPLNEKFTFNDIYRSIPQEKRPHYLGYGMISKFKRWADDSRLFKITTDPVHNNNISFIRITDAVGEIT